MKPMITGIAAFLSIIWGGSYFGELLREVHGWWVIPAFATVLGLFGFGILFAGMWWDGMFWRKS